MRDDGGAHVHGGDMNKTWSDLTDSLDFERVVHQDDPSFGREVLHHVHKTVHQFRISVH